MKTSTFLKNTFLCISLGFMTFALNAQILTIDNNPGSTTTYQTLQGALDNLGTNTTIYVQPSGTSYGTGVIDDPVTIVGRSHSEPGKKSMVGRITPRASNITLKGLEIASFWASTTDINNAPTAPPYIGLDIYECEINSTFIIGTNGGVTSLLDEVVIRGCVIKYQLISYGNVEDLLVSNNIFTPSNPIAIYNAATAVISYNIFKYYTTTMNLTNSTASVTLVLFNNMFIFNRGNNPCNVSFNNGNFSLTTNLTFNYGRTNTNGDVNLISNASGSFNDNGSTLENTDPEFTDVDSSVTQSFAGTSSAYEPGIRLEDDLTLQGTSPALMGGSGLTEIGLFNGGFNYEKLGNPRGLPSLDITSYDGAVPKNGTINVTITAKSY